MTQEERLRRIEELREQMRRTDERIERRKSETERTLVLIDRALERLRASR